jgi:hypothetical protein
MPIPTSSMAIGISGTPDSPPATGSVTGGIALGCRVGIAPGVLDDWPCSDWRIGAEVARGAGVGRQGRQGCWTPLSSHHGGSGLVNVAGLGAVVAATVSAAARMQKQNTEILFITMTSCCGKQYQ